MKKEKNRSIIYIAIFIALIMAISVIGFLWGGTGNEQYKYGDFSFYNEGGLWKTEVNGKLLEFKYLPSELPEVAVSQDAKNLILYAKMLYVIYSPGQSSEELAVAQYNLGRNIETNSRFVVNALAEKNENNLPVITCANATKAVPVIMLKMNETNDSIILNNSCLILEGNPEMLSERLVYFLYGVVQ